ncbi:MAG: hypothetical protein JW822_03385 [Spirochaetales bacterium]|nr:hypothetical protein [Spirochaetales bacterium]
MKNKYLIFIIACIALLIVLLIIFYTCEFFPSAPAPREQKVAMEETPQQNAFQKTEEIKPARTPQPEVDAPAPSPKKQKSSVIEDVFEYLAEYDGHTYYISKNKITWLEAAAVCEQNGGHLVTITSKEENQAIIEAIKAKNIKPSIWIGLTDYKHEGIWKWITGEKLKFSCWHIKQPDNQSANNRAEHFAQIWFSYYWNDASDLATSFYILEIEPK